MHHRRALLAAMLAGAILRLAATAHAGDIFDPDSDYQRTARVAGEALLELRVMLGLPVERRTAPSHPPRLLALSAQAGRSTSSSDADAELVALATSLPRVLRDRQAYLVACERSAALLRTLNGDSRADLLEVLALAQLAGGYPLDSAPTIASLLNHVTSFKSADPERLARALRLRGLFLTIPSSIAPQSLDVRLSPETRQRSWLGFTTSPADPLTDHLGLAALSRACLLNESTADQLPCTRAVAESVDRLGRTPLHWAARCGCIRTADRLLRKGADRLARDNQGKTPTDLARECGWDRVVDFLTH